MATSVRAVRVKDRTTIESGMSVMTVAPAAFARAVALPPVVTGGAGSITHGRQITAANTGHTAYFDSGLGRTLTDADLTVHATKVNLSTIVSSGVVSKRWFKAGFTNDIGTGVTVLGCRSDVELTNYPTGNHMDLQYVTVDTPGAAGDQGLAYLNYTAYRCYISGHSDGAKTGGNVTLTECYIRLEEQTALDHSDGCQNAGGSGAVTIQRCNIDSRTAGGAGNACLFTSDGCTGLQTWEDNLLCGGGFTIFASESTCSYAIQGNDVIDGEFYYGTHRVNGPVTWAASRQNRLVTAAGAFISNISL